MSTESDPSRCPKCGAAVPAEAPQGLCPRCVLAGAAQPTEAGQQPGERITPPSLEVVAHAFPQLEILELVGVGGMGVVYKARQPKLDRLVALKLLPKNLSADPAFAERFNREARFLARLNHPNIVSVFDFGQSGGFCYLLMEFVDGVNLRQAMQASRFSTGAALALVPRICEALQYAHDRGVLHRDIKPENLLLDAQGQVKIADFGIAKLVGIPGDRASDLTLTQSGARLGTPHYMAPEQVEKPSDVDHRADIYSLGVVFYELLTGELPLGRFAAPSTKTPLDERLDEIVLRALAKERELRQQSAGEVKTQVEHVTAHPAADPERKPEAAPSQPFLFANVPSRWKPWLLLGLGLGGAILAIQAVVRLVPMVGALPSVARSGFVPLALIILAASVFFAGIGRVWQHRGQWRRAFRLELPESSTAVDVGLQKSVILLLASLAGGLFVGLGSVLIGLALVLSDPRGPGFLGVPAVLMLAGLATGWRSLGRCGSPTAGSGPAWMERAAWWFLVIGGVALLPTLLSWGGSVGVWHSASLLVLTGLALFTRHAGLRRLALIVNWLVVFTGVAGLLLLAWWAQRGTLPPKVAIGVAGLSSEPGIAMLVGLLQLGGFVAALMALHRPPVLAAFGVERPVGWRRGLGAVSLASFGAVALLLVFFQWTELRRLVSPAASGTEPVVETESGRPTAVATNVVFYVTDAAGTHALETRTFTLRHAHASTVADDLRQILLGRPGREAKVGRDTELLVTAPADEMSRVAALVTVTDWPEPVKSWRDRTFTDSDPLGAARAFFYACAIQDFAGVERALSNRELVHLAGMDRKLELEINDTATAQAAARVRATWSDKDTTIRALAAAWIQYPLRRLTLEPGIAMGFGVRHFVSATFEGAPNDFVSISLLEEGERDADGHRPVRVDALPPWWTDPRKTASNPSPSEPVLPGMRRIQDLQVRLARERLDEAQKRLSVGAISPLEAALAERDLAVAESRGDSVAIARANLTYSGRALEAARNQHAVGRLTSLELRGAEATNEIAEIELSEALKGSGSLAGARAALTSNVATASRITTIRVELAKQALAELRKQAEVGMIAPMGREILDAELTLALTEADQRHDAFSAALARRDHAEKISEIVRRRYQAGKATKEELLQALGNLESASTALSSLLENEPPPAEREAETFVARWLGSPGPAGARQVRFSSDEGIAAEPRYYLRFQANEDAMTAVLQRGGFVADHSTFHREDGPRWWRSAPESELTSYSRERKPPGCVVESLWWHRASGEVFYFRSCP